MHNKLISETGGSYGLKDEGILQSTSLSFFQTFDSKELFPSIIDKVVRLSYGLIKFHPFVDGNKRIGAHAMLIILELNNIQLSYTQTELIDIFSLLASGDYEQEDLKKWVFAHILDA